jgi:DNA helicase II / ATP-dependent DNA helicase PcrA
VSEWAGVGLFRVGQFPHYAVPYADLAAVFEWRREQNISMLTALRRLPEISNISRDGCESLQRIADDVAEVTYPMSAHRFLMRYLFLRGDHLQNALVDRTIAGQQHRLAIYQFLQFAFSFRASSRTDPKRAFLDHIRRLEVLDEEKQLRQLPAASHDIDAVRMMTVHAAKGLQFRVVHIPAVTSRHFPVIRSDIDHPPPGLVDTDGLMSRDAEEESLFFVAMSRAEDTLGISRGVKCGGGAWSNVKPSPFLDRIASHLPMPPDASPTWTDEGVIEPIGPALQQPEKRDTWPAHAIEAYIDCPRRFYYGDVLRLGTAESGATYRRFQTALRASIAWLHETRSPAERRDGASARLAADWEQSGLQGHPFEGIYRAAAEKMLTTAVRLSDGTILPAEVLLTVGANFVVSCRADQISSGPEGVVVRRLKMGRLAKDEKTKARYAILQTALSQQNPGVSVEFEHVSLLTGEQRKATIASKKLPAEIDKIERAFAGISEGRFDPAPSDYKCPRCPYYFVCPSHGEVSV